MRFDPRGPAARRGAAAAILLLAAGRRGAANEDDIQLYQFQWDAPPAMTYESATTDGPAWSGSAYFFYGTDPSAPAEPDDVGGGGAGETVTPSPDPSESDPSPPAEESAPAPSPPDDPAPADAAPDSTPAAAPPDETPAASEPSQPPAADPAPPDPAPSDAQAAPTPPPAPAPTQAPGPEIARLRFNSRGEDGRVEGPGTNGSSFLWTDPSGLAASPWPSFQNPSNPVSVGASGSLAPAPAANH